KVDSVGEFKNEFHSELLFTWLQAQKSNSPTLSRLTAIISCAPQSATHRRPSCQRGDSPNARPVNRVCISDIGRLLLTKPLCSSFCLHLARRNRIREVDQNKLLGSCSATNTARIHTPIVPVLPDPTQTIMPLALGARLS